MAKITIGEIRDLLKSEKIQPSQLYKREELENDPIVKLLAVKELHRKEKDEKEESESDDNSMIPD